jgi:hypothetical protein
MDGGMMSPLAAGALLPTERAGVVQVRAPSHWQARPRLGPPSTEGVRDTTRHDTRHTLRPSRALRRRDSIQNRYCDRETREEKTRSAAHA